MMDTRTHYVLQAMAAGKLLDGMYTCSVQADTPEVALALARPHVRDMDAVALVRVETALRPGAGPGSDPIVRGMVSRTIMRILPEPAPS